MQLLQFHLFVQCSRIISSFCFCPSPYLLLAKSCTSNHVVLAWIETYDIQHWRIPKSICRKLAWAEIWTHTYWIPFRPSNRLRYQAVSLTRSQSQVCTATPILFLCSVFTFHFDPCLQQSPHFPQGKSLAGNHVVAEWIDTYVIHHQRFLEVAIKVGLSRIWNHAHLILFRRCNPLSYQAMSSTPLSELDLYSYSNFISLFRVHVSFRSLPPSVAIFAGRKVFHR